MSWFDRFLGKDARAAEQPQSAEKPDPRIETARFNLRETMRAMKLGFDALPVFLEKASDSLVVAKRQYQARAFGPFWDAIQEALRQLGHFNQNLQALPRQLEEYRKYRHELPADDETFPHSYPIPAIPNPRPVLDNLRSALEPVWTDFEFSLIWEQRKTQMAIVSGFKTMGDALAGLRSSVEQGFLELISQTNIIAGGIGKIAAGTSANTEILRRIDKKLGK